jgi:hypothetical protein
LQQSQHPTLKHHHMVFFVILLLFSCCYLRVMALLEQFFAENLPWFHWIFCTLHWIIEESCCHCYCCDRSANLSIETVASLMLEETYSLISPSWMHMLLTLWSMLMFLM